MGAWIEISETYASAIKAYVAPSMGAWIEIYASRNPGISESRRSLYGSVD